MLEREVMLGGDRTALEMLNDLIFDSPASKSESNADGLDATNDNKSERGPQQLTKYVNLDDDKDRDEDKNGKVADEDKEYEVTQENIAKLQRQIIASDDVARDLLLKHGGDQVASILEFHNVNYKPEHNTGIATHHYVKKDDINNLSKTLPVNKNMSDEGDNEDNKEVEKAECTDIICCDNFNMVIEGYKNDDNYNYQIALLSYNSDSFTPHKKCRNIYDLVKSIVVPSIVEDPLKNREQLMESCILSPIEFNNVLGLDNDKDNRLQCLRLNNETSGKIFKNWGMDECGMIFWKSQVVPSSYIVDKTCFCVLNKHATRLGRLVGYLTSTQSIIGNCAVVSNIWLDAKC